MDVNKNNNAYIFSLYTMLYVNDLACNSVYDVRQFTIGKDKETIKIYGALKKRVDNYFSYLRKTIKIEGLYFLSDYNQVVDEAVDKHVEMLKTTIRGCLRKHEIQDDGLILNTIVAHIFAEFAVTSVKALSEEMQKEDARMKGMNAWVLKEVQNVCRNFYFWVCRKVEDDVLKEMNNIIQPVADLISNSICNYTTFEKAYGKAVFSEKENVQ